MDDDGVPFIPLGAAAPRDDEVHLWYCPTSLATDDHVAAWLSLLSPVERDRLQRYAFLHSRTEYLLGRALVRTALSHCAEVHPGDWTFAANQHGKPEIATPRMARPLRFNLSHTSRMVVCAVTIDADIGVDVEDASHARDVAAIADRYFAPPEIAALRALTPAARRARFFELWTLKEAYVKARGAGLAIPLDRFSFDLDSGGVALSIDPGLGDEPSRWQFLRRHLTPDLPVAVAVAAVDRRHRRLVVAPFIPSRSEHARLDRETA